jgi:hypothetical protein
VELADSYAQGFFFIFKEIEPLPSTMTKPGLTRDSTFIIGQLPSLISSIQRSRL